jgi:hypothetical protein
MARSFDTTAIGGRLASSEREFAAASQMATRQLASDERMAADLTIVK